MIRNLLLLIRVMHWIKNAAIYLPAFFAMKAGLLLSPQLLILFFAFCFAASCIYIINDIIDVEKDRLHPEKCKRPLASGYFSTRTAIVILCVLLLVLILLLIQLQNSYLFVLGYFLTNLAYSFKLKEVSIIDVSCISLGFVLRILAGGAQLSIYVSPWMITIVFLLAISLAFAKRRDDLVLAIDTGKGELRKSLKGYTIGFLDFAKSITLSITMVSYIIYSTSPEVTARLGSDKVYITAFFVFLGIMRYLQITIVHEKSGSPTDILWHDRFIQITIILWIASFTLLLYGRNL
jgi:decaprenyl-phosphate phosphoribosyltransferase